MLISLRRLRQEFLPDISERSLRDYIKQGLIPVHRLGGRVLVDPSEVMAALRGAKPPSPSPSPEPAR